MILLALAAATASPPVPLKPLARLLSDAEKKAIVERLGVQGTVRFKLAVDASGRITGCTVTRTSGFKTLDAETCKVVQKRARFAPAKDGQGRAVAGSLSDAIAWEPAE